MAINQIATNYDQIMSGLNRLDEPRHNMYNATNHVRSDVAACVNWQGVDAVASKESINNVCNDLDNTAKWMNEMCWELKKMAQEMQQTAERQAAEARSMADQNGGMI